MIAIHICHKLFFDCPIYRYCISVACQYCLELAVFYGYLLKLVYQRIFQTLGLDVEGRLIRDLFPAEEVPLERHKDDRRDLHQKTF